MNQTEVVSTVVNAILRNFARTLVPLLISFVSYIGLTNQISNANVQQAAAIGVAALYYGIVRVAEEKYPKIGILLGAQKPKVTVIQQEAMLNKEDFNKLNTQDLTKIIEAIREEVTRIPTWNVLSEIPNVGNSDVFPKVLPGTQNAHTLGGSISVPTFIDPMTMSSQEMQLIANHLAPVWNLPVEIQPELRT